MEQIRKYFEKTFKLTEQDLEIFSSKLTRQEFSKKHVLLKVGQVENHLSFVETGIIRCYIPKEENELTFAFIFDNSFVSGYDSFLTQRRSIYHVETLTKTTLWRLTYDDLQAIYNETEIGNTIGRQASEDLLSDNLKFYHDKDGISDKTKFLNDLKKGICNNETHRKVQRFLVKESTEIFPLYKNGVLYGAVQNGEHTFSEKRESQAGIAKFTNVWQLENDEWKLITSFSFDHQAYKNNTGKSIFDYETEIQKWLKENKIPTLGIGIIENGKLQQVKVFGEISEGNPAPYNTIFNVASLTKPVTAIVALQLVSLGKWELDEPLYKYWIEPDIANDPRTKKLTTRIILSHQTGFPNWRWMNETKKLSFQFDPGTKYQYSGEGMEYLRKALEKKFNKSLQELANELIFQPLKMTDTKYVWDKNVDTTRLATGYDKDGTAYETVKNETPNAADDLLTTVEDYGKFLVSVMNDDGLSKKVFEEMTTKQVASTKGKHFGLGFEIYDLDNEETALSHGGADNGVQTLFVILPKTKSGLLIFTNSDTGVSVYETLLKHYLGDNGQKIFDIETK